ncbi:anosmin-1 Kallmann syndrome 1 isoform X2 [Rhodnius prolixus]|uniref:anosmin-1 Kallmann syndrome 1 isoform X2 n=1 Tax=Rhodnius prolixus TaxID=13249 RepID=UPI003D188E5A
MMQDVLTECLRRCDEEDFTKPGYCSQVPSGFEKACLQECKKDDSCSGIDKCCPNDCGFTCQPPINITNYPGIPPRIPQIIVNKLAGGKSAMVTWSSDWVISNTELKEFNGYHNHTVYVVEERHYIGHKYRPQLMGNWNPVLKKPAAGPPIMLQLKPATWYQVRIAAVSKNGSSGFSNPSQPFKSAVAPKPPDAPHNLTFSNAVIKNHSLWGVFRWSAPASELPISKYTVYWSKRISSDRLSLKRSSIRVNSKVVSPEKTYLKIKRLDLNTKYLLEVRAQVQYGKEKMCSEKVGINVNPSFATYVRGRNEKNTKGKFHIPVKVAKVIEKNGNLSAKIIWKGRPHLKYVVHWEARCPDKDIAGHVTMNSLVVLGTQLDISSLIPKCTYHVYVRKDKPRRKKNQSGKVSFIADPNCSDLPPKIC